MAARAVVWFETLGRGDVAVVGGKNASLGEMVRHLTGQGVKVPAGFATTADAYWRFVDANELRGIISSTLNDLEAGKITLAEAGSSIRRAFLRGTWPDELAASIAQSYQELGRPIGQDRCGCRGALERDGRGFAGRKLRRPAGIVPQYSRRAGFARCLPALLCLAVYRPRHRLPQSQGLRSSEGCAFDRHPEHGAFGPRQRRRDVLDRYRDWIRQGCRHQRGLGTRRKRRARRRRSRRISDL